MKKLKIGRPKLPKGKAKGRIVPIRFSPEAINAVEGTAKASGQTTSEWIRQAISVAIAAGDSAARGKNPAAVALSRLGASKGGKARAKSLTPKQRSKIAQKAAKARWG